METEIISVNANDIRQLIQDVSFIKQSIISENEIEETELTDWAKKELEEARKIPNSENVSLEEVEQRILAK